nr:MAG TPA: hypothetical protein [Caudoviricetes sp.]
MSVKVRDRKISYIFLFLFLSLLSNGPISLH